MPQNVYSTCSLPYTTGCFLYTDSGLTVPASNGIYSDGVNTYTVTGGAGEITSVSTCSSFTTSTTTTTTTLAFDHYLADKYDCTSCTLVASNVVVALPAGTPVTLGKFYVPSFGSGEVGVYSYLLGSSTGLTGGLILQDLSFTLCTDACNQGTTSTTTTTTTAAPATTTTTSTTTTTTTSAATTTSTTTSSTTLFTNLFFDASVGIGGYTIGGIDVNGVTPTLTGGTDVPFNTDGHSYNTNQIGTNETLNIFVSVYSVNGCITVTDSASNVFSQNITGTGTYSFAGLTIDNTTAVNVLCADGTC